MASSIFLSTEHQSACQSWWLLGLAQKWTLKAGEDDDD